MRMWALVVALAACQPTYEFETVSSGRRSDRAPRPKSNSQFLRSVYTDLLSRTPESYVLRFTDSSGAELSSLVVDESETLLEAAAALGDPAPLRAIIANGLTAAAETTLPDKGTVEPRAFVHAQFQRLLGREPTPYEIRAFVSAWADPAVEPRTIVRAIVNSREYQSF